MTDRNDEPEPQPFGVLPSRRRHDDAEQVDPREVLDRLRVLEVRPWREGASESRGAVGSERLGPAAEEFYEVFEGGTDPDHIAAGDADGAAIAAIQALADRFDDRDARLERQARQLQRQQRRLDEQRADIEALREQLEPLQATRSRREAGSDGA